MNYTIKATEVTVTLELRTHLEQKLEHLDKFVHNKEAARADVELDYLPSNAKVYRAEIMIYEPSLKAPLRAEATASTMYDAIDKVTGELFTELTRTKKKRLHNLRHGALKVKDFLRGLRRDI